MILIHLYIREHKAIRDLSISLSGRFDCTVSAGKTLSISERTISYDYYKGHHCAAIIGVNGSGKTTILDFMSAFDAESESSLLAIFYDQAENTYNICCANISPEQFKVTRADKKFNRILKVEKYLIKKHIEFVKVNALPQEPSFLTAGAGAKNKNYIKSLTVAEVLRTDSRRAKYFDQIFEYLHNYPFADRQDDVCFAFSFSGSTSGMWDKLYAALDGSQFERSEVSGLMGLKVVNAQLENCSVHDIFDYLIRTNIPSILNYLSFSIRHDSAPFERLAMSFFKHMSPRKGVAVHHAVELAVQLVMRDARTADSEGRGQSAFDEMERQLLLQVEAVWDAYFRLAEVIMYQCYNGEQLSFDRLVIDNYRTIDDLIAKIKKLPRNLSSTVAWGWQGVSSGELARMHVFSQMYGYLARIANNVQPIIMIDEADLYLHPEWQRLFLTDVLQMLDYFESRRSAAKVQVIVCTHSPIIISDFLQRDITSVRRNDYGGFEQGESSGFGSSVVDIYMKDMHLASTFGEHARKKLNALVEGAQSRMLTTADRALIQDISNETTRNYLLSYDKDK